MEFRRLCSGIYAELWVKNTPIEVTASVRVPVSEIIQVYYIRMERKVMGKKKIVGQDGKEYFVKEKKPFYKRIWFWALAIVIAFIGFGSLGSSGETDANVKKVTSSDSSKTATSESKKEETFKIGDTASIKGYEIKVNSVDYQNGGEYEKPEDGKKFVIVNITITNNTDDKQSFNPLDFSLNEDGVSSTTGFTYLTDVESLNSGDLDKGASVTGNLIGEANPDAKLKLRYEGNFFISDYDADFELN